MRPRDVQALGQLIVGSNRVGIERPRATRSEMIVVRTESDELLLQLRVAARNNCDDIARGNGLLGKVNGRYYAKRTLV